jgi:hypothetical protein
MKSVLPGLALLIVSSQGYAAACLFEPGEGQEKDNVSCLENRGAPADIFQELCASGGDETMRGKRVKECPANSLARCEITLSKSKGAVTQYTYSKSLINVYKYACGNHPLGESKWIMSSGR